MLQQFDELLVGLERTQPVGQLTNEELDDATGEGGLLALERVRCTQIGTTQNKHIPKENGASTNKHRVRACFAVATTCPYMHGMRNIAKDAYRELECIVAPSKRVLIILNDKFQI